MQYRGEGTAEDPLHPYPDVHFPELFRFLPATRQPVMFRNNQRAHYDRRLLYRSGSAVTDAERKIRIIQQQLTFEKLSHIDKQTVVVEGHIIALENEGGRLNGDTIRRVRAQYPGPGIALPSVNSVVSSTYFYLCGADTKLIDFIKVS